MGSYKPRHAKPRHARSISMSGASVMAVLTAFAVLCGLAVPSTNLASHPTPSLLSEPLATSATLPNLGLVSLTEPPATTPVTADNPASLRKSLKAPLPTKKEKPKAKVRAKAKVKKPAKPNSYVVRKGDTAYGIASKHSLSLNTLLSRNKWVWTHPDMIHVGDKFRLTGKSVKVPSWVLNRGSSASSRSSNTHSSAPKATAPTPHTATVSSKGEAVVNWAMARKGYPYRYGANGPDAYDCSSFTQAAWRSVGVNIPRTADQQYYGISTKISSSSLQRGDLVFFYGLGHVGIYIGNGMVIHASNPSDGVKVTPVSAMPYAGAARP